jgi:probable O-glycosylation ligase (exosortase A-associated)
MATIQSANDDASFRGRVIAWQVAYAYAVDHFPFGAGFYGPQRAGIFLQYFPSETPHAAHSIYFQVLGEHGFIGIFLYLALLFVSFKLCWKMARTKQRDETLWIQNLSGMLLISLVAFAVGGAALSMAYYDLFIIIICLLPQLALLSEPIKKQPFRAPVRPEALHNSV